MKTYWHRRANISIGTVTTLEPGSDATASVTEDNVLSFGIPQGAQGEQGIQGPPMTYDDMSAADKAALAGEVADDLPFASTGGHGVVQIGSGLTVDSDGVLSATGVQSPEMTGATASTAGTGGTVPAPAAGKQNSFLRGDATWATPPYPSEATTSAAGLMSAADKTKLDGIEAQARKSGWQFINIWFAGEIVVGQWYSLGGSWPSNWPYQFMIIEYALKLNPQGTGEGKFDGGFLYTIVPTYHFQVNPTQDTTVNILLQANDATSNKDASRLCTISRTAANGNRIQFSDAYFNGAKNNNYIIPRTVYGIFV